MTLSICSGIKVAIMILEQVVTQQILISVCRCPRAVESLMRLKEELSSPAADINNALK